MKQKIIRLLSQNGGFFQSTSHVVRWVVASQILMFACIPIISRLYPPAIYGVYAVFTSIMYVFNQIIGLRSEQLINIPKEEKDAEELLATSLIIVCLFCLILTLIFYLCPTSIIKAINLTVLEKYLWFVPLCAFIIGIRNSFMYWAVRQNRFSTAGIANFIQAPGMLLIQIVIGYFYPKAIVLIWGAVVSWTFPLLFLLWKTITKQFIQRLLVSVKFAFRTIGSNLDFLIHSTLSVLLLSITNYLPVILISSVYSTNVAAWFALAMQAIYSPMDLISISVSQVYLNKGSKILHDAPHKLAGFYIDLTKKLFLIGLLPIGGLALFGGQAFQLIFGDKWYNAGHYAQIMAFMLLFRFAVISTSQNMALLKKQRQALVWSILLLILMVGAFLPAYLLSPKPSPETTLCIFSVNLTIGYVIFFYLNLRTIKQYAKPVGQTDAALIFAKKV